MNDELEPVNDQNLSMEEIEAQDAVSLPDKEVLSLLDVNANVDLGLDLASPVPAVGCVVPAAAPSVAAGVPAPMSAPPPAIVASCSAVASALPLMDWSIEPDCWAMASAWASGLRTFALAAASIGAATLRFAAAARSTGDARSSPRSTFASTLSSDRTSLSGRETASCASISSIDRDWSALTGSISSFMARGIPGAPYRQTSAQEVDGCSNADDRPPSASASRRASVRPTRPDLNRTDK